MLDAWQAINGISQGSCFETRNAYKWMSYYKSSWKLGYPTTPLGLQCEEWCVGALYYVYTNDIEYTI